MRSALWLRLWNLSFHAQIFWKDVRRILLIRWLLSWTEKKRERQREWDQLYGRDHENCHFLRCTCFCGKLEGDLFGLDGCSVEQRKTEMERERESSASFSTIHIVNRERFCHQIVRGFWLICRSTGEIFEGTLSKKSNYHFELNDYFYL